MKVNDYTLEKCIEQGTSGELYLSTKNDSTLKYAIKRIERERLEQGEAMKYYRNELTFLQNFDHPNILKFFDVKKTKKHFYIIFEYCNGGRLSEALEKYLKKYGKPFPEVLVQHFMKQIIDVYKYIHSGRIIHGDIRLKDILLHYENEKDLDNFDLIKAKIKIIDFSFACKRKKEEKFGTNTKGIQINEKTDIWSLGKILYEMLTGKKIFENEINDDLIYTVPISLSHETLSFLNGMLQKDDTKILSVFQLSRHEFLNNDVKEFHPIDLEKISKNLDSNRLNININIKDNSLIWSIFNSNSESLKNSNEKGNDYGMIVDNYIIGKLLREEYYGKVHISKKKGDDKNLYATRILEREKIEKEKDLYNYLNQEINILQSLKHPNIVKLEDIKKTKTHFYLTMEYCNGADLPKALEKYKEKYGKPFSEEIVQHLMTQLISAIKYIHEKGIIHKNINLENIMLNFENEKDIKDFNLMKANVKIIDFFHSSKKSKPGLPINASPSTLKKLKLGGYNIKMADNDDEKVDIWSLGTIFYEILIGKPIFDADDLNEQIDKVEQGDYYVPKNISFESVSFMNGMLQQEPKKRLNAEQLLKHPFLTKNINEFTPIDMNKYADKLKLNEEGMIIINTKNNESVWSVFNEDKEN